MKLKDADSMVSELRVAKRSEGYCFPSYLKVTVFQAILVSKHGDICVKKSMV